ncbi:TetR/AcrR family transcriptional regulator [Alteromonas sp. CYL-A6]|uniref:TetR/AcrR family transcriptional regulator n=1 Tax=Alteromonas nitratireducens TaxID=3390813 RepID=UPI0034BF7B24
MKTAQRILLTALTLFNEHGENAVTSVDIALELDISPGNLYYHYKGKEVMVSALLQLHQKQMLTLLVAKSEEALTAEDVFYYFYLLIDQLHLFRFFYRSPADLNEKYPDTQRTRNRLMKALSGRLQQLLESLVSRKELIASQADIRLLTELMQLIMLQACQHDVQSQTMDEEAQRYHALSLLMVTLLPRLKLPEAHIHAIQAAIHSHTLANVQTRKTPESLVLGE